MSLPNKLRIKDGVLFLADGGDVTTYLKKWEKKHKLTPKTPLTMMPRERAMPMIQDHLDAEMRRMVDDERFCLAS